MEFINLHPPVQNILREVQKGFCKVPKQIPPKFFYDKKGSELFQKITQLPEYYLTKAELNILQAQGQAIGDRLEPEALVVEYGCGNSEKIHRLLDHLRRPRGYMAIDISKNALLQLAQSLSRDYPDLEIIAVCADFSKPLPLPLNGKYKEAPRLAFFPGSSIGNFEPTQAVEFLSYIRKEVGKNGRLLIGVDLKKDKKKLQDAYNDADGITEAFNKNLLLRLNRECGADFKTENFEHRAFYNPEKGRIEMHLVSLVPQTVQVGEKEFSFSKQETIHTENSYKYHVEEFQELARQAGWEAVKVWTDEKVLFSLQYFRSTADSSPPSPQPLSPRRGERG